jgi:signal transduction histidine kinase/ligand-binding sensor domain-containing protein
MTFAIHVKRWARLSLLLLPYVLLLGIADQLRAVEPTYHITQYAHNTWRIQDGFISSIPTAITQTTDGYIWIGTQSGLVRFDGIRFVPWTPRNGEQLISSRIDALVGASDGSLWIGTAGGVSHLVNNHLINYVDYPGVVPHMIQSRTGAIWIVLTPAKEGLGPLCQIVGAGMECHGAKEGITAGVYDSLTEDSEGNLWLGGETRIVRWRSDSQTVYEPPALKRNTGFSGFASLAAGADGTLWAAIADVGLGLGLQRLTHHHWEPFISGKFDSTKVAVQGVWLDRENALWVGTLKQGIYRIFGDKVEHFGSTEGLSSDFVHKFFEDREGNLWALTSTGIDNFRNLRVLSFSTREGLGTTEVDSIAASHNGGIWVGGSGSLDILRDGRVTSLLSGKGLPGDQVTSLFEDHSGRLWMGIDDKLVIQHGGGFHRVDRPNGTPIGMVFGIAEDVAGSIWIDARGRPGPLMRIQGARVHDMFSPPAVPGGRRIAPDPEGGIWLGLRSGDLARFRSGELDTFEFHRPYDQRGVEQITVAPDGSVLGATAFGLIGWRLGRQFTLTVRNGLPCDMVYAFVFDDQESLWLNTQCGIVEITNADLQKWWADPETVLQPKLFDVFDGALPGRAPFGSAAKTSDGRVWFADGVVLQMIDPSRVALNKVAPPVHIEGIVADRRAYAPQEGLSLPALTRDVQIDYTALSFVAPQKVRFRYKLDGRDKAWLDPGTRRQVFYTDLRPGPYTFRVIACNNDGVWNEEGAALTFTVAPAWYQTNWFLLLTIFAAIFIAWLLYILRIRRVSKTISARFDERLAERTRLARDLHDTLLQTIRGSKMVAEAALNEPADLPKMQQEMTRLSAWLGQATEEGREALNSLRASTTETNDLAEAFRQALDECRIQGYPEAVFDVEGKATDMHPIVRDEIFRIGYEAIRNACQHSKGTMLRVHLSYAADLTLIVSDNGAGIASDTLAHGKDGHFGLRGMRERAQRIGGEIKMVSSPDSGTRIELKVPGQFIFRGKQRPWWSIFARRRNISGQTRSSDSKR